MRLNSAQRIALWIAAAGKTALLLFPPTMIGEAGIGQGRGHRFLLNLAAEFDPMVRIDAAALATQLLGLALVLCCVLLALQDC